MVSVFSIPKTVWFCLSGKGKAITTSFLPFHFIFKFSNNMKSGEFQGTRSMMWECMRNDIRRLKARVLELEDDKRHMEKNMQTLRAKLELRNKEILALMKNDIIDLTAEEDTTLQPCPLRKRSLDEFISWAFNEEQIEETKDEEEVIYKTPSPNKKIKF